MSARTRIKLCGLTRPADVSAAVALGADAIGLVFYPPSPRYVSPAQAGQLLAELPAFVSAVGLFVNPTAAEVQACIEAAPISILQFHGDETPAQCPFGVCEVAGDRAHRAAELQGDVLMPQRLDMA